MLTNFEQSLALCTVFTQDALLNEDVVCSRSGSFCDCTSTDKALEASNYVQTEKETSVIMMRMNDYVCVVECVVCVRIKKNAKEAQRTKEEERT